MADNTNNLGDLRAYQNFRTNISTGTFNDTTLTKSQLNSRDQARKNEKPISYGLGDYNWSEDYEPLNEDEIYLPIQKAVISEFQPDFVFRWGDAVDAVVGGITNNRTLNTIVDKIPFGGGIKSLTGVTAKKAGQVISSQIETTYKNTPSKVVGTPINFIKGMFQGVFLNVYEIPFFSEVYLDADTTGNWSQGGSKQILGESLSQLSKESFNVDFPTTPTWQLSDSGSRETITNEFYLINNSDDNLFKNFKFLNALVSGAFWMQLDYIQKSPNVYDIVIPGRFHIYYGAIGVRITQVGKLRTNRSIVNKLNNLKSIDNNTLFPDAYKIEMNIVDLTPNSFNVYMDYQINGSDGITIGDTRELSTGVVAAAKSVTKALNPFSK